jgi:hypothetical protein
MRSEIPWALAGVMAFTAFYFWNVVTTHERNAWVQETKAQNCVAERDKNAALAKSEKNRADACYLVSELLAQDLAKCQRKHGLFFQNGWTRNPRQPEGLNPAEMKEYREAEAELVPLAIVLDALKRVEVRLEQQPE